MPVISVPPPFRGPTRGEEQVSVEGATVGQCLDALEASCPGFLALMTKADGSLFPGIKLFVGEDPVPDNDLSTTLADDAELSVVAAIGGGSC